MNKTQRRKYDTCDNDSDNELQTNTRNPLTLQIEELETKLNTLQQQTHRILQLTQSMYTYIGNLEQQFWTARFPPRLKHILCGNKIESNGKEGECVRDICHVGSCCPYRQPDDIKINNYDKSLNFINTKWTQHDKSMFI